MFDQRLNQLSSQIAQMTPQQRQQFALLHKNDPILVSLTKFVNDQDQAAKTALLAKTAPQAVNQPKVVDQTIAQMRPMSGPPITPPPSAQQGVGGLPAPNLAGMPDGGIAGQPDAMQSPQPGPGMAAGGVVHFDGGGMPPDMSQGDYSDTSALSGLREWLTKPRIGKGLYADAAQLVSAPGSGGPLDFYSSPSTATAPKIGARDKDTSPVETPAAKTKDAAAPKEKTSLEKANDKLIDLISNPPKIGDAPSGGGGAGTGITGLPGAAGLKLPSGYNSTDPQSAYTDTLDKLQDRGNPFEDQLEDVGQAQKDVAESKLDAVKRNQAELGIAGIDREKRLNARGRRLDENYKENSATALLSAGLAMMAGTSPNAFANIGNGAQVGLKQFTEGKAKLDEARDRLDDAFGQLEDLRRNEKRMNMKELTEAEVGVKQSIADHMKTVLQSTQQMYGVNSHAASQIVDANIKQAAAQLGYLGHVQGAEISGRYGLAGAIAHAGAIDRSSERSLQGHLFQTQVYGAGQAANAMHDPSRFGLGSILPKDYARYVAMAEKEAAGVPGLFDENAKAAFVNRRAAEMAQQAMQQYGGAGSAGAAPPATYRYDLKSGLVPNQ